MTTIINTLVRAGVPGRTVSGADYYRDDGDGAAKGLGGTRTAMIESFVHQRLLAVDRTACTTTPNARYRDHEVLQGTRWIDSKAGWFDGHDQLGYSPVDFQRVRKLEEKYQVDAIAIVPMRPEDISHFVPTEGACIVSECDPPRWWLVPVFELEAIHTPTSGKRQWVRLDDIAQYEVTTERGLSIGRLRAVCSGGAPTATSGQARRSASQLPVK